MTKWQVGDKGGIVGTQYAIKKVKPQGMKE